MKEKGMTTITLKKINKEKVYQYIYRQKEASKLQIVQDLQMGLSTVSQNLTELENEGLIQRCGYFDSTGGRKAQIIQIISDFKIAIGLGILKEMFHIVAVNLYGEAIASETIALPYCNTEDYYIQLAGYVKQFIQDHDYQPDQISGISIATQGIISPDGNSVIYGTIMENTEMKLSDFASKLPYPCHLEHDSKASAYLELWHHPTLESAIVFLLNRNLGGAVITHHNVHHGIHMHSGLFEHVCVDPAGPLCYCGHYGCLETYCSANALEVASGLPAKTFFTQLREDQEEKLVQLWKDYLNHLAYAIRNINLVIDSPIIISGYLAPYFTEQDMDYLLNQINTTAPFKLEREQLIVGTHGQYTPAIGAALYYVKAFLN